MSIDELLRYAAKYGASDLHITVGNPPIIRVNGKLKKIPGPALAAEDSQALLYSILTDEQRIAVEQKRELDLSYTWGTAAAPAGSVVVEYVTPERVRARVNVFMDLSGLGGAFRIIPAKIRALEELPAPESVAELTRCASGLVLVTGHTGCGKSTTLASMIDRIDAEQSARIITIEDPIEYIFQGKNCLISQREIGTHSRSFADALRACLREDPNVILVGEMRDLETIRLAMTAAETGHFVLSTLHTNSVAQTVDRVIDVFPSDQHDYVRQIFANVIRGIISQTLLPRKDQRGRVSAMEVLIATPAVKNMIRESKSHQVASLVQTGSQYGMQTMDQCLAMLLRKGLISADTAHAVATDKKLFAPEGPPGSAQHAVIWALAALLGLVFGSFFNVCIWRIPLRKSISSPPSHCPRCRKPIRPYDNIPVLSWLILRGRCRDCGQPISARYPLIEALTALLFIAAYARFGFSLLTVKAIVFISLLILTAFIDLDHQVLPFGFSVTGLVLGLAGGLVAPPPDIRGALAGAAVGAGFILFAILLWRYVLAGVFRRFGVDQKEGMGIGDLPYAAMIGAFVGLKGLTVALAGAVVFGVIIGLIARSAGRNKRGQPIPFGPFLALGALAGLFFGPQLFDIYARFAGLQ